MSATTDGTAADTDAETAADLTYDQIDAPIRAACSSSKCEWTDDFVGLDEANDAYLSHDCEGRGGTPDDTSWMYESKLIDETTAITPRDTILTRTTADLREEIAAGSLITLNDDTKGRVTDVERKQRRGFDIFTIHYDEIVDKRNVPGFQKTDGQTARRLVMSQGDVTGFTSNQTITVNKSPTLEDETADTDDNQESLTNYL